MYKLFDISFLNDDYHSAIEKLKKGAFMVVPSGPGLATIDKDKRYAEAVQKADFAIPDSGYMVLLLKYFKRINLNPTTWPDEPKANRTLVRPCRCCCWIYLINYK